MTDADRPTSVRDDERMEALAARVAEYAAVNTGTGNVEGLRALAPRLMEDFAELRPDPPGAQVVELPEAEVLDPETGRPGTRAVGPLLRFVKRPDAPARVLLAIHYDTVFGADHPFRAVTRPGPGVFRGPGVADAKGGIVVMLEALARFEARSAHAGRLGWEVILNPDEEIGSPASTPVLVEAARRAQVGLVFEPALPDGALVSHRRGAGTFAVTVRGRAAHVGRDPEAGRNAVHALARLIAGLDDAAGRMAGVTLNVARLADGRGPVNVVPDVAWCAMNVRFDDEGARRAFERELAAQVDAVRGREGFGAEVHGSVTAPPKPLDEATRGLLGRLARCAAELGMPPLAWRGTGGVCDGNRLAAAGLPTVDSLGPVGSGLHSDREEVQLASLVERAELVARLLEDLAVNGVAERNG